MGATVALDVTVWPWPERKFGWFVEPSYGQPGQREIALREGRPAHRHTFSKSPHTHSVHSVAHVPRAGKNDVARAGVNVLLSTRHEIAAGILRVRPTPAERTPGIGINLCIGE